MHLVFLNQYYPPDAAPTGVMLEGVVEELVRDGHEVTVLCASGGYADSRHKTSRRKTQEDEEENVASVDDRRSQSGEKENVRDRSHPSSNQPSTLNPLSRQSPEATPDQLSITSPRIIRLRASRFGRGTFIGKLLDYASYYLGVAWKLLTLRPAPDRIVALTTPPLLSVLARLLSKLRGADHAHWVMDLYPDVMAAHGMLRETSVVYRILAGLARWGFGGRRRAALLTLGPDMAERVERLVGEKTEKLKTEKLNQAERDGQELSATCPERGPPGGGIKTETREEANHARSLASPSTSQPSTLNHPPSPVQWVPLWAADCSGVSACLGEAARRRTTVAGCPSGREGESDAFKSDSTAGLPQLCPLGESATVADAPLQAAAAALRLKRGWTDRELIVMYSGNMGLGHRFGEILAAARRVNIEHRTPNIEHRSEEVADSMDASPRGMNESRDELPTAGRDGLRLVLPLSAIADSGFRGPGLPPVFSNYQRSTLNPQLSSPIRFVFFGGGKRRVEVETFVRADPGCLVEVHDYAPAEELAAHLQSADVHLASLDAAWTGTMVPSKLQGIFAAGRPVIFIGSAESSIGRWVAESGGGWVVAPGDVDGLLAALDEAQDPGIRLTRGRAAERFAATHFDRQTNIARVAAILGARR